MPVKYQNPSFNPDSYHPLNIDRLAVERVPNKVEVLDIGCATGFMGKFLIEEKKCKVYGLDLRNDEISIAKKNLTDALVVDVERKDLNKHLKKVNFNTSYDIILATSVIEHLKEPSDFLKSVRSLLKKDGKIIVTTPNVAHWSIRLSLLKGNFDYTEYGILDNTHLHLFTMKSFKEIFDKNGFNITEFAIDPVGGGYPRISKWLSNIFPGLFAYQMVIVAKLINDK